jgi:cytochrome P450
MMLHATPGAAPGLAYLDWCGTMRDNDPVWKDPQTGAWNIFRYEDVSAVLSDHRTFGSDFSQLDPDSPQNQMGVGNIVAMDPPLHHKFRGLVSQAFTPRAIARLEPRISDLTHELLNARAGRDGLELVADLTYPLPVIVIAELLGVPAEDRPRFREWADVLLRTGNIGTAGEEETRAAMAQFGNFHAYLREHIDARRAQPREDLLSGLVAAELDGQRLTDDEIAGFATILLVAGHVTTTALLGSAIISLDENPDAEAAVRADEGKVAAAIEEVLRYRSPVGRAERIATTDTRLGDQLIRRGDEVDVWIPSANHDERQFESPDRFDIGRTPNPHLAFAKGIHFCLGAPLARLEGRVALSILLRRYRSIRVDQSRPPVPYSSPIFNSVEELHVLVEPSAA